MYRLAQIITGLIIIMAGFLIGCTKNPSTENRSPGERKFISVCQSCHNLPKPADKTDDEWPSLVNQYGQKANLSQDDIKLIISYLIAAN